MRLAGVPEELITGDVDPWNRFQAWAATMPRLVRNPLYVWTHLELRRVFDIDTVLDAGTAKEIWDGDEPAPAEPVGAAAARPVPRRARRHHGRPG